MHDMYTVPNSVRTDSIIDVFNEITQISKAVEGAARNSRAAPSTAMGALKDTEESQCTTCT